ncbi:hypothetical protein TNIN_273801 [Trichonephila inaurata madagascariensis]|uniref:Uncharacterized protein n=1 Tax=Trichonephila inaurata madagascariensis TaxID=2747483 RepID=A0A8X7CQP1_9ARAC|nr:hypothetical protein TNIN_273801 [Trichonephila inaurata madagascariensis]
MRMCGTNFLGTTQWHTSTLTVKLNGSKSHCPAERGSGRKTIPPFSPQFLLSVFCSSGCGPLSSGNSRIWMTVGPFQMQPYETSFAGRERKIPLRVSYDWEGGGGEDSGDLFV